MAKPKRGRVFADEAFEYIIDVLAAGEPLARVTSEEGCPTYGQLQHWLREDDKRLERYRQAMAQGAEYRLHVAAMQAGDESRDFIKRRQGNKTVMVDVGATVQRRDDLRLRSAQWLASRLHEQYRDKIKQDIDASMTGSLVIGDTAAAAEVARKRREGTDA